MEDPNYIQTTIFSFIEETPAPKKRKARAPKKGATTPKVEATAPKEAPAVMKETAPLWREKIWEFDLTVKSQDMKDRMKEAMVAEGLTKREANHIFKGLVFKEKVCNTRNQALEYLESVPSSYAVKYKIGIEPSAKMISLEKRLAEKEARLQRYIQEEIEKKFRGDFISCPHCKSKLNSAYVRPPLCPLCGEDMRPSKTVKNIAVIEETIAELRTRYEDTARKYNSKFTGGEKWIIRLLRED